MMMKIIDRVWEEDLRVGVCYGGWPGIPGLAVPLPEFPPAAPAPVRCDVGALSDFPDGLGKCVRLGDSEIAVFRSGNTLIALSNRCPHTGGPLALGRLEGDEVICPWHGAAFDAKTGIARSGPTREAVAAYAIGVEEGRVHVSNPVAVGQSGGNG
jgi:nitrite reductase/ring-hydroxylating ferredoxin subunit